MKRNSKWIKHPAVEPYHVFPACYWLRSPRPTTDASTKYLHGRECSYFDHYLPVECGGNLDVNINFGFVI